MDALRKQLDVLMGANRNGNAQEVIRKYLNHDVCHLYLTGLCPHELFQLTQNTGMDFLAVKKAKPTQHSVWVLQALGLTPHFLACHSAEPLLDYTRQKLLQFCHVLVGNILNIHDVPNIWHIPLLLQKQNAHEAILRHLELSSFAKSPNLQEWTERAQIFNNLTNSVRIAMVGKYVGLTDSYLFIVKV